MLGAVVGDIVGSRFEGRRSNIKTKDFEFFSDFCRCTDDSVMTLAICDALLHSREDFSDLCWQATKWMQMYGRFYSHAGYGRMFKSWIFAAHPEGYDSFGNGSAMRVSGCAYAARSLNEVKLLSRLVTEVTHGHPEGIKGAEAVAVATYLALHGSGKSEIKDYITGNYYDIDYSLDDIREEYSFDVSCQGSVPQGLQAFFESTDFEDAIRGAISIGGDSDTIAAIAGAVAGAYYGVPEGIARKAERYLDGILLDTVERFEMRFGRKA